MERARKIVTGAPVNDCPPDAWKQLKAYQAPAASKLAQAPQVDLHRSGLEILGSVLRDAKLLEDQIQKLPLSDHKHGDLQVSLSAARRLAENFQALIEEEETH